MQRRLCTSDDEHYRDRVRAFLERDVEPHWRRFTLAEIETERCRARPALVQGERVTARAM